MLAFVKAVLQLRHIKLWFLAFWMMPFAWLVWGAANDALGANPAEYLIRSTGELTLRLLCVTLAITPLRQAFGLHALAKLRRMSGLLVFFYASLHLLSYAWLDMGFEWMDVAKDIAKRPFILVGFTAAVLLTLLAATSFNQAVKWLGAQRWQLLHRTVYLIAGLALLHFFWMRAGKNNFAEVWLYTAIIAALLAWRVKWRFKPTLPPNPPM